MHSNYKVTAANAEHFIQIEVNVRKEIFSILPKTKSNIPKKKKGVRVPHKKFKWK